MPVGFVRVGKMEIASYITNRDGHTSKIFTYSLPKIRSWKVGAKVASQLSGCSFTSEFNLPLS